MQMPNGRGDLPHPLNTMYPNSKRHEIFPIFLFIKWNSIFIIMFKHFSYSKFAIFYICYKSKKEHTTWNDNSGMRVLHNFQCTFSAAIYCICDLYLKGTATLIITMFYTRDLNKPWILIPVSSKSVEKRRSCGRLNVCKWTVMEAAIL